MTNKTDTTLLNTQINSPAVIARFPYLANPNNVYPGFPATQTLLQALRPYPQWNGIPPFLGPPMGNTWYDSLQVKVTKRFSHGLSGQLAYTWQKELTNGTNSNTSYVTPSPPLINDVYSKALDKQISGFSIPQELIIAFNYTTPKLGLDSTGGKMLSWLARDWTIGGVLRYQSGQLLQSPFSANNLLSNLGRGPGNNPALWGGGYTFLNRVSGQPLFLVDPNSKFDPTQTLVLNPKAWVEPPYGTFGASAPYFNDFRWQRQPAESMAFGRTFRIKEQCTRGPGRVPEHLQPPVLSGARRRRAVRLPIYFDQYAYAPWQPRRDFVARLRLRELGEWRTDAIRRRPAQVGPDRGALHLLSFVGAGNSNALPPRAFPRGAK